MSHHKGCPTITDIVRPIPERYAMPLAFNCDCGRALRVKDELAGKKIRCPECKSILTVPDRNISDELELEVIPADEDEETARKSARRAAIQTEPPEAPLARRRTVQDEVPTPRKRSKASREIRRSTPSVTFERGWFGSINAGVVGGILMMLIAVVWFVVGLAGGIIFFYPPILFVIGIVAIVKGGLGSS